MFGLSKIYTIIGGAILAIGIILGGVWFIYSKGASAAEAKAEARHIKELVAHAEAVDKALNRLQGDLEAKLDADFNNLDSRIGEIDSTERTIIRPTLIKEIKNDAKLADPNFTLPDGVRNIINKARAESACPERATGGDCATLSRAPSLR